MWWLDKAANEVYMIRNYSGKCLEIENSSTQNGARAQQWACNRNNDTMMWHLVTTDGQQKLINHNSGKCLEIENSSSQNGARAQQWDCAHVNGQDWSFGWG